MGLGVKASITSNFGAEKRPSHLRRVKVKTHLFQLTRPGALVVLLEIFDTVSTLIDFRRILSFAKSHE